MPSCSCSIPPPRPPLTALTRMASTFLTRSTKCVLAAAAAAAAVAGVETVAACRAMPWATTRCTFALPAAKPVAHQPWDSFESFCNSGSMVNHLSMGSVQSVSDFVSHTLCLSRVTLPFSTVVCLDGDFFCVDAPVPFWKATSAFEILYFCLLLERAAAMVFLRRLFLFAFQCLFLVPRIFTFFASCAVTSTLRVYCTS